MAKQTIQVADKPTLDEVKALLENSGYGLEAIKNALGGGYIPCSNNIIRHKHRSTIGDSNLGKNSTLETVLDIQGKGLLYSSILSTSSSYSNYYAILKITVDDVVKVWRKLSLRYGDSSYTLGFIGGSDDSINFLYGKHVSDDNDFNSEYNESTTTSNTKYRYPLLFNKSLKIEMICQSSVVNNYCYTEYELL